jgi:hypothetical protein
VSLSVFHQQLLDYRQFNRWMTGKAVSSGGGEEQISLQSAPHTEKLTP